MGTGGDPKSALSLSAKLIIYWQVGELVCALFVVWGTRAAEEQKNSPCFGENEGSFVRNVRTFARKLCGFPRWGETSLAKALNLAVGIGGG